MYPLHKGNTFFVEPGLAPAGLQKMLMKIAVNPESECFITNYFVHSRRLIMFLCVS